MPGSSNDLSQFLAQVPKADVLRRRLTANIREAHLLRQLIRIAERREAVEEAAQAACAGPAITTQTSDPNDLAGIDLESLRARLDDLDGRQEVQQP